MSNSFFAALLAQQSGNQANATPLNYQPDLRMFMDAENLVVLSGVDVVDWGDSDPDNATTVFDTPASGRSPVFDANIQNGLPGINFQQPVGQTFLNRKVSSNASQTDDHWVNGTGFKSLAFAAKLNRLTDSNFNTSNTIVEKGYRVSGGWRLRIDPSGSIFFEQRRANGSTWSMTASGFYSVGDLVLGYLNYDGGNTTSSGFFRLYDGTNFVTVGAITTGSSSTIGTDTNDPMIIGNTFDPNNANTNAPFEGPIFSLWMTAPGVNTFDEQYLARWIP